MRNRRIILPNAGPVDLSSEGLAGAVLPDNRTHSEGPAVATDVTECDIPAIPEICEELSRVPLGR